MKKRAGEFFAKFPKEKKVKKNSTDFLFNKRQVELVMNLRKGDTLKRLSKRLEWDANNILKIVKKLEEYGIVKRKKEKALRSTIIIIKKPKIKKYLKNIIKELS